MFEGVVSYQKMRESGDEMFFCLQELVGQIIGLPGTAYRVGLLRDETIAIILVI